jgi:hypothetical protein
MFITRLKCSLEERKVIMRADEFLTRLQQVTSGKEMVDLLVEASIVAPPLRCPFPPEHGTRVAVLTNTPEYPAGTRGQVNSQNCKYNNFWTFTWGSGRSETINKTKHDQYRFVYVY